MSRILVVEDEQVLRGEIRRLLERAGHEVHEAADFPSAVEQPPTSFDLVLSDLRLPGGSGDGLLAHFSKTPLILMTAFGSVRSAVRSMKQGAVDYLSKPFNPEELLQVVQAALGQTGPKAGDGASAKGERLSQPQPSINALLGNSPSLLEVKRKLAKVAPTDATVLVLGESGTGKELVARALHAASPRAAAMFIPVNCAAIPESLIESELFGHRKGSFTGAHSDSPGLVGAAAGGTLFLDEIGELPLSAQARLLRVLQEKEVRPVGAQRPVSVDVRVVAATHQDLALMVEEGRFRKDLYYRLRVFELRMPPLRDRGQDVVLIANHLLERVARRLGKPTPPLSEEAMQALQCAQFPGNVRELENALQRALILHEQGPIDAALLGLSEFGDDSAMAEDGPDGGEDPSLDGYFRRYVLSHQDRMSETELAERLGLSRKGLWEKRQRLGLPRRARK